MHELVFHGLNEEQKKIILEATLGNKGKCISVFGGMCGEIYVFDQGGNVSPRYVCAKIPKPLANTPPQEANNRFVNELRKQISYNHHMFVHWVFDFTEVCGSPVALFRYWGNDLEKLIKSSKPISTTYKLSIIIYICSGLIRCYENGLVAHQDLKPANIFLRNVKSEFPDLPDLDIYNFALIADFGLANAFQDSSFFGGSRPYMAPEQWSESKLSPKTDVFALGVIIYELMSGGFHPVGIKLSDYWPQPLAGNTSKWTKADPWKKWAKTVNIHSEGAPPMQPELLSLVRSMLSVEATDRPSIEEVKTSLLDIIKSSSQESFEELVSLVSRFERSASKEPLKDRWPYLWEKWIRFEAKFGKGPE